MTQIPQAALDLLKQQGVTARPGTPEYTRQISTAAANRPPPRSYSEFYNVGPKSESGRWSGWAMPEQTSEEAAWTNPAYNPTQNDNGYTRFDHTIYGSGLERSKNFEAGARTFAAYQKLKPGQPGYDHARGALKKLSYNFGIDNWRAASPRQLFESFDLEMRGLQEDNQKENFKFGVGDLAKLVAAAAATVATAGAAAPYFGATLGGTVATGALAGAVGATTSGVLNNNLSLKGVVTGAGIGGLLAGGQYYFNPPVANPSLIGGSSHSPNLLYSSKALGEGTLSSQLASQNAVSGLGNIGSASDLYRPSIFGTLPSATGPLVTYSGASANSVFGALPATGDAAIGQSLSNLSGSEGVLSRFPVGYRPPPLETAGLYPSGTGGIGGILGGRVGDVASKAGDFASKVLSPSALLQASTYGSNEVPAGGGLFSGVLDQLPRAPTITYLDHAPISSGVPAQAGFERTSNIGVPSKYSSVPTELPPDTAPPPELPYGSGFDPYASTTDPNFDVSRFLGVGSLNETGQNMFRFSHGGGVGSLNETARAMPYAGGGLVRAAAMVWQPFKVKIKNQAIFGDFMGYTKTGKVRVLDQESGVEKLYPKSRVRRAYSDEPLPDEPVKKVLGGAIVGGPAVLKTAAEVLKRDPAGFFNKSQLVVQEAKLPQATGQRWQQLFQDKGINKAELGGLGLLTFLGLSGDEPITKETVAEFIDQNRLEVGEDYRSTTPSADAEEKMDLVPTDSNMFRNLNLSWPDAEGEDTSSGGFSIVIRPKEYRFGELGLVRPTQYRIINLNPEHGPDSRQWRVATDDFDPQNADIAQDHTDYDGTLNELKVSLTSRLRDQGIIQTSKEPRWASWILESPGGGASKEDDAAFLNYREISLTDQQTGGLHKNTRELINKLSEQAAMAAFKPLTESQTQPRQHNFPENTLVHIRVTDRPISINGVDHENVLYSEEFQSDWAQGAIGRGILRPEDISRKAELINKLSEVRVKYSALPDEEAEFDDPEGKSLRKIARLESREMENEIEALDRKQAYSPFLESGDKKGSIDQSPVLSLAISRLLKEAVDNGQDYVVFSNYKDQVTRWGETKLEPLYQETIPNLAKKIVKNLGGYGKPKFKTKEKENKYYEQNPDKAGRKEDAFFADTVIEPLDPETERARRAVSHGVMLTDLYPELSGTRFVVHITDAMAKKIREEGQPVLSRATGGGVSSLNGIARNMTRYAYGGGVGSMNEIARSM